MTGIRKGKKWLKLVLFSIIFSMKVCWMKVFIISVVVNLPSVFNFPEMPIVLESIILTKVTAHRTAPLYWEILYDTLLAILYHQKFRYLLHMFLHSQHELHFYRTAEP